MPELPEVQTVINDLNEALLPPVIITGAAVFWPKTVAECTPSDFDAKLRGRKIQHIWRRAKYIVIALDNGLNIVIHLRMTGHLLLVKPETHRDKHEHVILYLADGRELRFHDTRKFGRFYLTSDPDTFFANIGPEPLSKAFSPAILTAMLKGKSRKLKPLLLDQNYLAGLGNIYVDEALWEAKLHPAAKACDVTPKEAANLYRAIVKVLQSGLDNMGTTLGTSAANYYSVGGRTGRNSDKLQVFRRQGQPCSRCGALIEKLTVSQRGTHICPVCQTVKPVVHDKRCG